MLQVSFVYSIYSISSLWAKGIVIQILLSTHAKSIEIPPPGLSGSSPSRCCRNCVPSPEAWCAMWTGLAGKAGCKGFDVDMRNKHTEHPTPGLRISRACTATFTTSRLHMSSNSCSKQIKINRAAFVMFQSRSVLDLLKFGDAQLFASSGTFNVSVTTTEHRTNKYLKSRDSLQKVAFWASLDVSFPFLDRSHYFSLDECNPEPVALEANWRID